MVKSFLLFVILFVTGMLPLFAQLPEKPIIKGKLVSNEVLLKKYKAITKELFAGKPGNEPIDDFVLFQQNRSFIPALTKINDKSSDFEKFTHAVALFFDTQHTGSRKKADIMLKSLWEKHPGNYGICLFYGNVCFPANQEEAKKILMTAFKLRPEYTIGLGVLLSFNFYHVASYADILVDLIEKAPPEPKWENDRRFAVHVLNIINLADRWAKYSSRYKGWKSVRDRLIAIYNKRVKYPLIKDDGYTLPPEIKWRKK